MLYRPFLAAGLLASIVLSTVAQVSPPSWRKSNITTPHAERVSIAVAATEKAISMVGPNGQFGNSYAAAGNLYYQLAELDIATNQTRFQDALQHYFLVASEFQNRVNFSDSLLENTFVYGYAAARAYLVYNKNPLFLQYAIESWWFGRSYTLSQADIDSGGIPVKNFTLVGVCKNATMAGGTFHTTDPGDTLLNGLATGYFAVLSALLAEATTDPMFLQAAEQSIDFIHAHLDVNNVIQDGILGGSNDSCNVRSILEPYNAGLTIEALAILTSVTKDASTQTSLDAILESATVNNAWQESNGIMANKDHGNHGDITLIRGISAAYSRNVTSPDLRVYIEGYLAVQFNAVMDFATSGNNNIYGDVFIGPPPSNFSAAGQTTALSVLLGTITIPDSGSSDGSPTPSASLSPSPSEPPSASSNKSWSTKKIVGIAVGSFVGLVGLVGAVLWLLLHKRRSGGNQTQATSAPGSTWTQPPDTMQTEHGATSPDISSNPVPHQEYRQHTN
ncbi:hypothetical protein C8J57DRAFT_1311898 [Mycena rebaudengoi]|nr:hypothetical protein C8J57DRAFT_1311898 [Mycena rebaudengoi]